MGLLPKRSLKFPINGENRNCIKAYAPITHPKYFEPSENGTCAVSEINVGNEGMIIPNPIESRQIVIKIKINADFEFIVCM